MAFFVMMGVEAFMPSMRSRRSPSIVLRNSEADDEKREPRSGDQDMSKEEESEIIDAKMEQVPRMVEFDPVALPDEVAEGSTSDDTKQGKESKKDELQSAALEQDANKKDKEEESVEEQKIEQAPTTAGFDSAAESDIIEEENTRKDTGKSEKESKQVDTDQDTSEDEDKEGKLPFYLKALAGKGDNISFIQSLGAITGRGEFATTVQKQAATKTIAALEAVNPTERPITSDHIYGRWELIYCSTQLFRSSPFFMAGRAVCKTKIERDRFDWFCDMHRQALAISSIQAVRQIITKSGRIVSEFEVTAGALPFIGAKKGYSGGLPFAIEGALVSSADWVPTENSTAMELFMDTVEVKGSNVPILRLILDQDSSKLPSRRLANKLERVIPSYKTPKPIFKTTYLDESLRISRDQDDNVFVYIKTSEEDNLTNYSDRESDLGVKKLVYGFRKVLFP